MSRECFYHLLDIICKGIPTFKEIKEEEVGLEKAHKAGIRTKTEIKLASTLRFLAGGSVHDISLDLDIGTSSV